MIIIEEKSPINTYISRPGAIRNYLRMEYEHWEQGRFHMEHETRNYSLVNKQGIFHSGYQNRVMEYLDKRDLEYQFKRPTYFDFDPLVGPSLPGIEFRQDQWDALNGMLYVKRGVWKAPTGSGKTVIIGGLVSALPKIDSLIMVHTQELLDQTHEELSGWFDEEIGYVGKGRKFIEPITVATVQTLIRLKNFDWKRWGMLIVDEAHHINDFRKTHAQVARKIPAPYRFGLTATLPKTDSEKLVLEGLIGPLIGETSYHELREAGVLAVPHVRMFRTPQTIDIKSARGGYAAVYDLGIVTYRARNKLIVDKAMEQLEQGRTVLIMIERIEHGDNLMRMFEIVAPGVWTFLHNQTPENIKRNEKKAFEAKVRKGVIATRIWSEGVNIKSIGCVINAVGGESEIATIQRFGRGMRKVAGKDRVILIDFFDSHHNWFIKHSGHRMCTYLEWGWL